MSEKTLIFGNDCIDKNLFHKCKQPINIIKQILKDRYVNKDAFTLLDTKVMKVLHYYA